MNRFQIEHIPTPSLVDLASAIKLELSKRRRDSNNAKRRDFIATFNPCTSSPSKALRSIEHFNSTHVLSVPLLKETPLSRGKYLRSLISQDWSDLFPSDANDGDCYVYAHVDPGGKIFSGHRSCGGNYGGTPFYIGKGKGDRAYNLKRNQGHGKKIKTVTENGWCSDDIVKIVFSELSDQKAFEIESKLIYFFGTVYQEDRSTGILYNLDIPKAPEFAGVMKRIPNRKQLLAKTGGES
jgi:hypothetical protein